MIHTTSALGVSYVVDRVQEVVARHYDMPADLMRQPKRRQKPIAEARAVAQYLLRIRYAPELSLPALGHSFGGMHHTSVLAAVKRVEERLERDGSLAYLVAAVRNELDSRLLANVGPTRCDSCGQPLPSTPS